MAGEFELINLLKYKFNLDRIGDDCAILPFGDVDLLVTSDMLVEGVDFKLEWTTWGLLGYKSLAVSLSDIAAMGGEPRWAMLSLAIPSHLWIEDDLTEFYEGWHQLGNDLGVELVGGDLSGTDGPLVIDSTVIGTVPAGTGRRRDSARAGESIFVTGYLGGAAAGLELLRRAERMHAGLSTPHRHLLLRQLQPIPQIRTGKMLNKHRLANAMIDISDGLSSELYHIAQASGVGCLVDARAIPVDPAISSLDLPDEKAKDFALNGGEDFELLFTAAAENVGTLRDLGFYEIGLITDRSGTVEMVDDGRIYVLPKAGFVHY